MQFIKLIIDPGHGGEDWGLKSDGKYHKGYDGCLEKNINMEVASRLSWYCAKHQLPYILTRHGDRYTSLQERCHRANESRGLLFLSIHCNFAHNTQIRGLETWYYRASLSGRNWAIKCQSLLRELDYTANRGIKAGGFFVLRHTSMPAFLVELGYLSNPSDCRYINNEVNQDIMAQKLFEVVRLL